MGSVALALQRRTAPPVQVRHPDAVRPPMPWRLLVPLALGALALGSLFGALEVATVALAEDEGRKVLSGLMLAAFSFGSLVAGVVAGALAMRRTPLARARLGMTLLAVGTCALPLLPGLLVVSVALLLTGPRARPDADRALLADRGLRALGPAQRGHGVRADRDERRDRSRAPGARAWWPTRPAARRRTGCAWSPPCLAALAGVAVPSTAGHEVRGYARPGEHVDQLGRAEQL